MYSPSTATRSIHSTNGEAGAGRRLGRLKRGIVAGTLATFLGAAAFTTFGTATTARAAEWQDEWHDNDGSYIEIWKNDDGSLFIWGHDADGEQWTYTPGDNPNPFDETVPSGPTSLEDILELIKKAHGEGLQPDVDFWGNVLGKGMTGRGEGLIPVYNPSEKTYDDGTGGGTGFDPNGGDFGDQLGHHGSPGGQSSGGQDKGDHADDMHGWDPQKTGLFEDDMPGPPELINPNPVARP